jgi:hypothetical protein
MTWTSIARTVVYRLNAAGDGTDLGSAHGERPPREVDQASSTRHFVGQRHADSRSGARSAVACRECARRRAVPPGLGQPRGGDTAVPFAQLVPNMASDRLVEIPPGQERGDYRVLGGDTRLTAMAPAERAAQWQTTLVWLVLIGGAGALALLALRLWREARLSQDRA